MKLGIIGGSGLYAIDGLANLQEVAVETPFGAPSDVMFEGRLTNVDVVFLPRHGRGHRLMPAELNHRANIFALKTRGVDRIISFSAVGSLREDIAPGDFVLVDQFVDRTKQSAKHTFFGNGVVAHIAFAHPTCPVLRSVISIIVREVAAESGGAFNMHNGGTYLNMEGPAFSTLAESILYKSWGMDVIGMTNLAEAKLSREAEICYLPVAMVTDYDCWHEDHESVSVEMIIETLMKNAATAKAVIKSLAAVLAATGDDGCDCRSALDNAIITAPDAIPAAARAELAPIIGKYIV